MHMQYVRYEMQYNTEHSLSLSRAIHETLKLNDSSLIDVLKDTCVFSHHRAQDSFKYSFSGRAEWDKACS